MLPLVVIGASDQIRDLIAAQFLADQVSFYDTAEAAHYALTRGSSAEVGQVYWRVNVAYGPKVFGALAMGRVGSVSSARLPHEGHTVILGYQVDGEAGAPRRVVDGQAPTDAEDRSIWQAASVTSADLIIDLATTDAVRYLINYLETR